VYLVTSSRAPELTEPGFEHGCLDAEGCELDGKGFDESFQGPFRRRIGRAGW
jgi:hypothetical protein